MDVDRLPVLLGHHVHGLHHAGLAPEDGEEGIVAGRSSRRRSEHRTNLQAAAQDIPAARHPVDGRYSDDSQGKFQSRFNRVSIAFDCCLTTGKFRFVLLQIGFSADAVTALKLVEKVHLCSVISNDRDSSSTINCYQDNGDDDEWRWAMAALISNRFSLHFEGRSESATGAPAGASGPAPNRPAADDKSLHDRTAAHGSLPQSHPLQVRTGWGWLYQSDYRLSDYRLYFTGGFGFLAAG